MIYETASFLPTLPAVGFMLIVWFCYWYYRPARFPRGPRGIPVLGAAPFLGTDPPKTLWQWSCRYGPVMAVRMGRSDVIMLSGRKTIHTAFVEKADAFSGRPFIYVLHEVFHKNLGISFLDSIRNWKLQRQFGVRTLKRIDLSRKSTEERILDELEHLNFQLAKKQDQVFNPQPELTNAVANVICLIVLGKRFEYDDPEFQRVIEIFDESFTQGSLNYLFFMTWFEKNLRFIPPFRDAYLQISRNLDELREFIKKHLEWHFDTFDNNDIRDFSDAFIEKMRKSKGTDNANFFQPDQLLHFVQDLLVAGIETTTSSLRWALLCLLQDAAYQENIYGEIKHVIGEHATPRLRHQQEMPYTKAFLQETRRFRSVVPLAPSHKTTRDVTLNGFFIPKNTEVIANQWSVNNDPNSWESPEIFSPERHLDDNNNFILSPEVMSFSLGPRHCLGQDTAQSQLFLLVVGIIQKFRIDFDPKLKHPPSVNNGRHGSAFVPAHFEIVITERD